MSSPYPRDDFDAVTPPRDGRRGAHRAAPKRPGGVLAPVVVALVVAAAGGAGYVAWSTVGSPASASSAAGPAPAAQDGAQDAQPAAQDAPGAADPSAPAPSEQPVDRSAPVVVLNGTGTSGLAAKEAAELEEAGWQVASTGNATSAQRAARSATTVLHPTAQLQAAAEALAEQVGATAVLDPQAQPGSLTVVLR
ncbi:LytR C-terminal domain-containing protein [Quadrisphaera sp. KR29]|uniref:LytR C-terminal domain-containing protein n=1 Tax=Quadrisphaera sp. KR29 TaxID=3461391 RepID=UPI00404506F0